ncbi:MAG: alpha/beta hydrolase [Gemmataceae bacterium]
MANRQDHASFVADVIARIVASSGFGYLATTYTMSKWLTRMARAKANSFPCERGLSWEPLECRTSDNFLLHGWVISPENPRGTVALFHGLRGNRGQTLDRAAFLVKAGFRCVAFDHRAHGESTGRLTSFGFYEHQDVMAVARLIRNQWPEQPLGVLGISMGAAAICFAGSNGVRFDSVVLEGLYHDIETAFFSRIGTEFPIWFRHFLDGVIWVTERRLRIRLGELSPGKHIHMLGSTPVLLLTGSDDPYATPNAVRQLYEKCCGPRELYVVSEAGHENVFEVGGEEYQKTVLRFLTRTLSGSRMAA